MPMIDVYASAGTFSDSNTTVLAQQLAATLMRVQGVPNTPLFRKSTVAFFHEIPTGSMSNVDGDTNGIRIQVLTYAGAFDRDKQIAVVNELTRVVTDALGHPTAADYVWVLLTEAAEGGWGIGGHANTREELRTKATAESG